MSVIGCNDNQRIFPPLGIFRIADKITKHTVGVFARIQKKFFITFTSVDLSEGHIKRLVTAQG
jgi:hypothetical protein